MLSHSAEVPKCLCVRVSKCLNVRVSKCLGVWVSGCLEFVSLQRRNAAL